MQIELGSADNGATLWETQIKGQCLDCPDCDGPCRCAVDLWTLPDAILRHDAPTTN